MNIYTLLLLCATTISILVGLSVYSLNRKASTNRLFMLIVLVNAYWAFANFLVSQASGPAEAAFWGRVLAFWPFLDALMLNFALVFTESDLLKSKLTYFVLYFPALLFSLIDLTTTQIFTYNPILQPWGYVNTLQNSVAGNIYGAWSGIFSLSVLFCFVSYHHKVIDKTKKRQTALIATGFSIPILVSLFTDSMLPAMGFTLPVMGPILGSVTSFFVVYAMFKYELFMFTPEIAAENVFSTMPDSVILVNMKGVITKVNRSLVELTGYSETELVGQQISKMLQRADVLNGEGVMPQLLAELLEVREVRNYEISFNNKLGERKAGVLSGSLIAGNNGHDVGFAFVLHDITERKTMEEKLLRSERFASVGELAAILGHDLRNPLSGIRGANYFLKRKHSDVWDAEDRVIFESVEKSIDYSNKIINDLLDYSREIKLDLSPVTPKALIRDVLSLAALPSNIELTNELEDTPVLSVDQVKICRAFVNLVRNAIDAMPDGGGLHLKSEVTGGLVVFTFTDTGYGMSEATLARIWTPLFTTKAKGMGFGLAICKRLVEAHGGRVWLSSVLGEGTTARVELPLGLGGEKSEIVAAL